MLINKTAPTTGSEEVMLTKVQNQTSYQLATKPPEHQESTEENRIGSQGLQPKGFTRKGEDSDLQISRGEQKGRVFTLPGF